MSTSIYGKRLHLDTISLGAQKDMKFFDAATTNSIAFKAASSISSSFTLTLPSTDSTGTQALVSDGAGNLSWASIGSSSLTTGSIYVGVAGVQTQVDTLAQGDITANATGLHIKTGIITNTLVSASAAIAYSKLNLSASIVNADVATGAAIAYAKLNLAASIVNADVATGAAIAYSKLALTGSVVNADISASAAIAYSKLALTASIVNADIASAAAIAYNKLAALSTAKALVSDGSGFVSASTTTATEIGYVSGVTSAIQTQLNARATFAATDWVTATGTTKAFTHNLGTTDIIVQLHDKTDNSVIEVDSIVATDANTVTLTASQAPGAGSWRVIVVGA